jgi:hypothetical protein
MGTSGHGVRDNLACANARRKDADRGDHVPKQGEDLIDAGKAASRLIGEPEAVIPTLFSAKQRGLRHAFRIEQYAF